MSQMSNSSVSQTNYISGDITDDDEDNQPRSLSNSGAHHFSQLQQSNLMGKLIWDHSDDRYLYWRKVYCTLAVAFLSALVISVCHFGHHLGLDNAYNEDTLISVENSIGINNSDINLDSSIDSQSDLINDTIEEETANQDINENDSDLSKQTEDQNEKTNEKTNEETNEEDVPIIETEAEEDEKLMEEKPSPVDSNDEKIISLLKQLNKNVEHLSDKQNQLETKLFSLSQCNYETQIQDLADQVNSMASDFNLYKNDISLIKSVVDSNALYLSDFENHLTALQDSINSLPRSISDSMNNKKEKRKNK